MFHEAHSMHVRSVFIDFLVSGKNVFLSELHSVQNPYIPRPRHFRFDCILSMKLGTGPNKGGNVAHSNSTARSILHAQCCPSWPFRQLMAVRVCIRSPPWESSACDDIAHMSNEYMCRYRLISKEPIRAW
jgi:hypothetical protein